MVVQNKGVCLRFPDAFAVIFHQCFAYAPAGVKLLRPAAVVGKVLQLLRAHDVRREFGNRFFYEALLNIHPDGACMKSHA